MTAPLPLGAAVLDPATRTLAGPGGTARLTPQPMRLLLCLAAVRPRVLPYDEAVACLNDRYNRADKVLVQQHLAAVRRALRLSGSGAVAETVYAIGVRLRAPAAGEAGTIPREAA